MSEQTEKTDDKAKDEAQEKKSPWDNDLPAGDAPPPPTWQLWTAAIAWGAWVVFILVMAIERVATDPR